MVDLTQPLSDATPAYPGDPRFRATPALGLEADGCVVHRVECATHTGTHVDAPAHVIPGGRTVDQLTLEELCGTALVLHAAGRADRGLSAEELGLHRLAAVPGIVLLSTGWSRHFHGPLAFRHPFLLPGAARRLRELGMRVLGVDMMSPDPPGAEALPVHQEVLGADGVIVENLRLPEAMPRRPEVGIYPLPLVGLDGSPARVVAR